MDNTKFTAILLSLIGWISLCLANDNSAGYNAKGSSGYNAKGSSGYYSKGYNRVDKFEEVDLLTELFGQYDTPEPRPLDVITVKTRDVNNADASGFVYMVFEDRHHNKSRRVTLPNQGAARKFGKVFGTFTFTRNSEKAFDVVPETVFMGNITSLEIWQEPAIFGLDREWKPELVTLHKELGGEDVHFPIDRWFKPGVHYFFDKHDTCLPQNDRFHEQRQRDLESQRRLYEYSFNGAMKNAIKVKVLPPDDAFSVGAFYNMIGDNSVPILLSKMKKVGKPTWDSYKDFHELYDDTQLKIPMYANDDFRSDEWFGMQRLQGIDPGLIELATTIPSNFGIDVNEVNKLLEKFTLPEALAKNKIFIVDLKINEPLKEKLNLPICAPLALFYLNSRDDLVPIAIQLNQKKGEGNPVFYPSDYPNLWQLVKFYYNHAEAAHHQSIAHFSRTHTLMEGVAVATQRNLALNHPVYRILKPHFIYTFAINKLVGPLLTTPGGLIDSTMDIGHEGLLFFNNLGLETYDMKRDGFVIQRFIDQKVTNATLPYYPYRDDITDVFLMIRKYVSSVLRIYYKSNEDVKRDTEILEWRRHLSGRPEKIEGLGIKGVPGDNKHGFQTIDQLIDTVTIFINIASGIHSTVNFLQYEWYGYPPNYAAYLKGPIPTEKRDYTEWEVLNYLPNRSKLCDILMLARYLVTRATKNLGDFEVPMLFHPDARQAVKTFQEDIKLLSKKIKQLNKTRKRPYKWSDPSKFPNAVNI